jgi:hypothetical protein
MSFAIINNFLVPNIKATNLGILSWVTIETYNKFKNPKDGSFGVKHPKRCS